MLKIRLRRTGAKFQPSYRVVVADSRAPRDGAFVAILGHYNPRTDPPTIQIDQTALAEWIRKGAQPTDSVLSLLKTAGMAPEILTRFKARLIGAGGKRGVAEPAAPAPEAAPAEAAPEAPATTPPPTEG